MRHTPTIKTKKAAFLSRALLRVSLACAALLFFSPAFASETEITSAREIQELHERAKNLYDVADYRAALNLYERILERNPRDGTATDISGWCYRYLGDLRSAGETFKKALTMLEGKDAVWVLIGLGELCLDVERYDEALSRLKEALSAAPENQEAAERASRGIERAQAALTKIDPTKPPKPITNALERQQAVLNKTPPPEAKPRPAPKPKPAKPAPKDPKPQPDAKPDPKDRKPAPGRTPAVVYGVALGSNIDEALAALAKAGYPAAGSAFTQKGRMYHPVRGFSSRLSASLTEGAVNRQFYVTDYNEGVLSLIIQLDYDRSRSFGDLKAALEQAFSRLTGRTNTRGVRVSDNLFSYEMGLALSNTHGIWAYATDRGDGTCRLEIEHIDLTNLSHYWMGGGR